MRALLGVSEYQRKADSQPYGIALEDATVEQIREAMGGQLQPLPATRLRWYLADLETAQRQADAGYLLMAAQLVRAMRRDGVHQGLLGTRCGGLVRLPKRFYGDSEIAESLKRNNGSRSVFDEMFPQAELQALSADGIELGVGVAELCPVEDREYPVMVRQDPENLFYLWQKNAWFFKSTAGLLRVTPGDGRWILHLPGARMAPWNGVNVLWPSLGRSFINKEHAMSARSNYSAKLANPARVAFAPQGASEPERKNFFRKLMAWGLNSVFDLPPGWDVKLLESNGIGIKVFQEEINTSDMETMVALSGSVPLTTGGLGFANMDIFKAIRGDLIQMDGDGLAYTVNTQGLPVYIATLYGEDAISARTTTVDWNTSTPAELKVEADTLKAFAEAIEKLSAILQGEDSELDLATLSTRFAVPLKKREGIPAAPPAADDSEILADAAFKQPEKAKAIASAASVLVRHLPPAAHRMPIANLAKLVHLAPLREAA